MGVQRIPNGSLHYASGTLETLCHAIPHTSRSEGQREGEWPGIDGGRGGICKLVEQVNVHGG